MGFLGGVWLGSTFNAILFTAGRYVIAGKHRPSVEAVYSMDATAVFLGVAFVVLGVCSLRERLRKAVT